MSADMDGYTRPVPDAALTRVLVIDDEAPIRLLCRVNLEAEGIHVLEAADGTTGLGLFIARGLVTAMGGRIWVSSREGEGSRFSFELPAAVPPTATGAERV